MLDDPAIFPPADVMKLLEGASPDAASNQARMDIWSEFKQAIGG